MRIIFATEGPKNFSKETLVGHLKALGPLNLKERIASAGFIFFFLGSLTTSLHHISTASIAGMTIILLLVMGAFSKVDFQRSMDWPMIFFLLGMDSMMRTMAHLGLDRQLSETMSSFFSFLDGSFILYTLATLVVTLVLRLAFPVAAGMLLSFLIMLPVTIAQGYSPWVCVFMTAVFSDIWFFRYQNSIYLIIWNSDAVDSFDQKQFMQHNMLMNIARVLCIFAAIPFWSWMSMI
jgi:hypothetical protein